MEKNLCKLNCSYGKVYHIPLKKIKKREPEFSFFQNSYSNTYQNYEIKYKLLILDCCINNFVIVSLTPIEQNIY